MATKYYCDRCTKSYTDRNYITTLTVNKPDNNEVYGCNQMIRVDICSRCYIELQEWVKPLPK